MPTPSLHRASGAQILPAMPALILPPPWKPNYLRRTRILVTGYLSTDITSFRDGTFPQNPRRNLPHRNLHRSSSDGQVVLPQIEIPKDISSSTPRSQASSLDSGLTDEIGVNDDDPSKIETYYQEKLKSDPSNSLLLMNYARFSHQVEKDNAKAEALYGRAMLASPNDGEVLSLYGALIWETERDEGRAKSYYERAVQGAPGDCMVLGSYAHFMWETEEDEAIDQTETDNLLVSVG